MHPMPPTSSLVVIGAPGFPFANGTIRLTTPVVACSTYPNAQQCCVEPHEMRLTSSEPGTRRLGPGVPPVTVTTAPWPFEVFVLVYPTAKHVAAVWHATAWNDATPATRTAEGATCASVTRAITPNVGVPWLVGVPYTSPTTMQD